MILNQGIEEAEGNIPIRPALTSK